MKLDVVARILLAVAIVAGAFAAFVASVMVGLWLHPLVALGLWIAGYVAYRWLGRVEF